MSRLNRFNWIARSYDKLVHVTFGGTLHSAQMNFISEIGVNDNVLILGGGSGKFLKDLLTNRPLITVTYIEASSEMIALAKRQVNENPSVNFVHGTQDHVSNELFDVVITNFFLDLFRDEELQPLVNTVSKYFRVNGKWLVAEFENTQKFRHRFLLSLMYLFFRITGSLDATRLPVWRSIFKNHGLILKAEEFFKDGFVSASVFVKDR